MANGTPGDADRPTQFRSIGQELAAGLRDGAVFNDWAGFLSNGIAEGIGIAVETLIQLAAPIAAGLARGIARGEDRTEAAFGELAAVAIQDTLGVSVSAGAWTGRGGRGGRTASVQQMTGHVLNALFPISTSTLQPSTDATTRYMSYVLQMGLEGWLEGWIFELLTSLPYFPGIETFADLDDILSRVLGLERMTRRVLGPYVSTLVVTPAEWHVNRTYRPRLLSPAEGVRQYVRGRWSRERLGDELAIQGYSDERIEAIIASNRKRLSVSQIVAGVEADLWSEEQGREMLQGDGYDADDAQRIISIERFETIARFNRQMATAAVAAYASGAIQSIELDNALNLQFITPDERQGYRALARFQREVRARELSAAELEAAAKRTIIPVHEYRSGLARLGYTPEAIGVLELMLRDEMNDATARAREQERRAAELAAEHERKRQADAERRRRIEEERATKEPSLAQFERAVVRGLVSLAAYEAFLIAERYAGDVIAFLVELAEQRRLEYVEDQQRRADAAARAERSQIPIGQLERAVERGVLSAGEYRAVLTDRDLPGADVELLARLADERRAERVEAERRKEDAERRAQDRGLSLAQLERAVLRGVRSLGDYQADVVALGFDAAEAATLVALLQADLDDRAAAAVRRREAEARAQQRGLSLAQVERAVLRGVRSLGDYQAVLASLGFPAADVSTLVDVLRIELDEAARARDRRAQIEREQAEQPLSLAQVERAVAAGLLSLDAYRAYLAGRGYAGADQDVLVSLVMLDLQEAAAARERRAAIERERSRRSLSSGQVERAVRAGAATVDDYRAVLAREGFEDRDRALLVDLLEIELASDAAARARRAQIERERSQRSLSLAQAEEGVRAGTLTVAHYREVAAAAGYDQVDQAILVATLVAQLAAAAERAERTET